MSVYLDCVKCVLFSKSPFHLSRRGWGEFPLRIQLYFHGKMNKPVDIIHNLVLDKTYTGRQTLGSHSKIISLILLIQLHLYYLKINLIGNRVHIPLLIYLNALLV